MKKSSVATTNENELMKEISKLKEENNKLREENGIKNNEIIHLQEENNSLQKKLKKLKKNKTNNQPQNHFNLELLDGNEIDKLSIIKSIGRGSQSEVFDVTREQHYALKTLLMTDTIIDPQTNSTLFEQIKRLLQEYEILHLLNHRNVIRSFGFFYGDEKHSPSILLELCPYNLVTKVRNMNDCERVCCIIEISLGMEAVHAHDLIHRDLKPENILIDENGHVKISDFGIACIVDVENQTQTKTGGVGTLKFMAPELLQESTHYTNKVDVYSFGVVVFYILSGGQMPKINIGDQANGKKAPIPSQFNDISRKLINRCWSKNENDRPSFTEIIDFIKKNKFKLIDGVEYSLNEISSFTSLQYDS